MTQHSAVEEHRDHDGIFKRALMALLNDYVLKDEERALVGLDPLPPEELATLLAAHDTRRRVRKIDGASQRGDAT